MVASGLQDLRNATWLNRELIWALREILSVLKFSDAGCIESVNGTGKMSSWNAVNKNSCSRNETFSSRSKTRYKGSIELYGGT